MRISEFDRAAAAYRRRSLLACVVPMGAALVGVFAFASFGGVWRSFLVPRVGPVAIELLAILPIATVLFLGFATMIALSRWIGRRWGIPCPHCGKRLANHPWVVVASRNCPHCGQRVLEDRSPPREERSWGRLSRLPADKDVSSTLHDGQGNPLSVRSPV